MMLKKIALLLVALIVLPTLLAACGGDDVSAEDAEKAIKALYEGDVDEANKYTCDEQKISAEDMSGIAELGFEVGDVSCSKDGNTMNCDVTVTVMEQTTTQTIPIAIKDGKLCSAMAQ